MTHSHYQNTYLLNRKKEEEKKRQAQMVDEPPRMSQEEIIALNKQFGYPDPPVTVCAIGKPDQAAVWWIMGKEEEESSESDEIDDVNLFIPEGEDLEEYKAMLQQERVEKKKRKTIIAWEICRYRRELNGNEWTSKGSITIRPHGKDQIMVENLSNGFEYRFTVKAINGNGPSAESAPSNAVVIEAKLPLGWFRFYDKNREKFYYANLKTHQSSWVRPDLDPDFLDEQVILNFNESELKHCRELFEEEIYAFGSVSIERFDWCLRECGEKIPLKEIKILYKAYADVTFGAENTRQSREGEVSHEKKSDELKKCQQFMAIMQHVKNVKIKPSKIAQNVESFTTYFTRRLMGKLKGNNMEKVKFGDWKEEWNEVANRNVYTNTVTKECRWEMPDEVRFYLPPKMYDKLMTVFDYGHIETFKKQFSQIDVDSSGDISDTEIRMLFDAMNIKVSDNKFKRLVRSIDLNGNGSIEFDEFCFMMYCIVNNDKNSEWGDLVKKSAGRRSSAVEEKQSGMDDDEISQLSAEYESKGGPSTHAHTLALFNKAAANMYEKNDDYSDTESEISVHDEDSLTHATDKYGYVFGHVAFGGWKMAKAATWAAGVAAVAAGKVAAARIKSEIDKATKNAFRAVTGHVEFGVHGPYCFCGCRNLLNPS